MTQSYPILLREATLADAGRVSELSQRVFVQTFVEEFGIPYPPSDLQPFLANSHGARAIARRIEDPKSRLWVAEIDQWMAGYASAGPMSLPHPDAAEGDVELYRLYVAREYHGTGVSRVLMKAALDWMEASGRTQWIGVWSGNYRAQDFYARYGFEQAGEYDYPVGETIDREFILRRG